MWPGLRELAVLHGQAVGDRAAWALALRPVGPLAQSKIRALKAHPVQARCWRCEARFTKSEKRPSSATAPLFELLDHCHLLRALRSSGILASGAYLTRHHA